LLVVEVVVVAGTAVVEYVVSARAVSVDDRDV